MTGNETLRNRYGIFLRDSQNGGTIACRPANDRTATSPPMRVRPFHRVESRAMSALRVVGGIFAVAFFALALIR